MTVYKITNKLNNKKYIGITNNIKKRWGNHCCNHTSPIGKAIQKYGKENFTFEVIKDGLTIEEAEIMEIELIASTQSLISENGYNIALGGLYNLTPNKSQGEKNANAELTDEEVQYIKDHRNIPEYILYENYSDKIGYAQFKSIYRDDAWKHITTNTEPYPFNLQFSCQFTGSEYDYGDILEMRQLYQQGLSPEQAYNKMNKKGKYQSFMNAYRGDTFKLIMPEVFSNENRHKVLSAAHSGELNGRAKLTVEDVKIIRNRAENGEDSIMIH